ncbi:MAG: YvcK family protein [Chloroflexi bacterium]|nr:YvcK family protein [Chloroflexota bacterium]
MPADNGRIPSGVSGALLFLLQPGLSLKRWVILAAFGGATIALGVAFALQVPVGMSFVKLIGLASLRSVPPLLRGLVFVGAGLAVMAVAALGLYRSVFKVRKRRKAAGLLDSLYLERILGVGPRVVAIGGGTGLSSLLRGLKHYTANLTAVVTVADDGGSSGRLRTEKGMLPPGDIRNCLAALADSEDVMQKLMDYRFTTTGDLNGHSFGNMLIAALASIGGGFDKGIEMAGELLAIRGKVIPSTPDNVVLVGSTVSGRELLGESRVGTTTEKLQTVALVPANARAHSEALLAIEQADLIVLGPGSLFTSIVPNLLVREISEAIVRSRALKMYIANVAEQKGETEGLSVLDHLNVVRRYGGKECVDIVVVNRLVPEVEEGAPRPLTVRPGEWQDPVSCVQADVVDVEAPTHHDPMKLASVIAATYRRHRVVRLRLRRLWRGA